MPPSPPPAPVLVEAPVVVEVLVPVDMPPPAPVLVEVLVPLEVLAPLDVAAVLDEVVPPIWAWQLALSLTPEGGQQISVFAPSTCVQTRPALQSSLPSWVAAVSRLQRWPSACRPQPGTVRASGTATANVAARAARVA